MRITIILITNTRMDEMMMIMIMMMMMMMIMQLAIIKKVPRNSGNQV